MKILNTIKKHTSPRRIGLRKILGITIGPHTQPLFCLPANWDKRFQKSRGLHLYMYIHLGTKKFHRFYLRTLTATSMVCMLPPVLVRSFLKKKSKFFKCPTKFLISARSQMFNQKASKNTKN